MTDTLGSPPENPPRKRRLGRAVARWAGVGLYQITVRATVTLATALLFVYFGLNSPSTVATIAEFAGKSLPGRVVVGGLRWGPSPGSLRLGDVRLFDPEGVMVLGVKRLELNVALLPLLIDVASGKPPNMVRVQTLTATGIDVRIAAAADGTLRLTNALVGPPEPPDETANADLFRVAIDSIGLRDSRFAMDLNGTKIAVEGLGLVGDFHLEVEGERVDWSWSARGLAAKFAELRLASFDAANLAQLPSGAIGINAATGNANGVQIEGVRVDGAHTVLERGDVEVRWAPELDVAVLRAALRTRAPQEPFLGRLLGDLFDAHIRFEGDIHVDDAGRSTVQGNVKGGGRLAGFDTSSVRAAIEVAVPTADGDVVDVVARDVNIEAFGGTLTSPALHYRLGSDGEQRCGGKITTDNVSIAEALASPAIGLAPAQTLALAGVVNGAIDVRVRLRTAAASGLFLDARSDLDLQIERDPRAGALRDALPTIHLRGGLDTHIAPDDTPPRPLWLALRDVVVSDRREPAVTGEDGKPTLAVAPPMQTGSATWIEANGEVDLHAQTATLQGGLSLPNLGGLLGGLEIKGIGGALRLQRLEVEGPWLAPRISAQMRGERIVASGVRVDDVESRLAYQAGTLRLAKVDAHLARGRITGDVELDLFNGDFSHPAAPIKARGKHIAIREVALGPLLTGLGVEEIGGRARVDQLSFSVSLDNPARSVVAAGRLVVDHMNVRHERFDRVMADFRFGRGNLEISRWEVDVPPLLRRGEASLGVAVTLSGRAKLGLEHSAWSVDATIPPVRFDQFGEVRTLKMPLRGTIAAVVHAEGDKRDFAFSTTDLTLRGLAWDQIVLGDATLAIVKPKGGPALVTSERFFPHFSLREGSLIGFRKMVPEVVSLALAAERFDPWVLLGLPAMDGLRLWIAGNAEVRFDFRPGQPVFSVEALLPPGGIEIEMQNGLDALRNRLPAAVRVLPDRVEIDSTEFVFAGEAVELCGTFKYANEALGKAAELAFYLSGHVEVPRFGALADSLANLELGFDVGPDPVVAKDPGASCLRGPTSKVGAMRIAGPLDAIVPQGRIVLTSSRLVPRGYGHEIFLNEGAHIDLSADSKGRLVLEIPAKAPIVGRVDDGRFRVWGRATLAGYAAHDIDVFLDGADLNYAAPKEYALTVTPSIRFRGKRLDEPKRRDMLLSGELLITEGQYTRNFDVLGKVIGGVRARELEDYTEPLLERVPWIGAIRYDLAVRGQNFQVLSRLPFGRTDLDLGLDTRLRGSIAAPELFGRVDVMPGSLLTYSVVRRDFEVTEGSIDFNGAIDKAWLSLQARTEIPLETSSTATSLTTLGIGPNLSSSSAGQVTKVTVTIRISGPLDDPRRLVIGLSSVPSYDQGDIQSLILTGQLLTQSSEQGTRASINVLTDDLAQAFSDMVLSTFVDSLSIGIPTAGGGFTATVRTAIGKRITVSGNVFYNGFDNNESTANFSVRLGERFSLDGLLRSTNKTTTSTNVYETKLRFRAQLDE